MALYYLSGFQADLSSSRVPFKEQVTVFVVVVVFSYVLCMDALDLRIHFGFYSSVLLFTQ